MQEKSEYVDLSISNNVGIIEFHNSKGNSLTSNQLNSLKRLVIECDSNPSVNFLYIRSKGENVFCAGASFVELSQLKTVEEAESFFYAFGSMILSMVECKKLIIGRVQGKVVGGGVGLISGLDYSIAGSNSEIKLSEISIAIGPFVIEPFIKRKIGVAKTSEMALNPKKWYSSSWVSEAGLFTDRVEQDNLNMEVEKKINEFSEYSPYALQKMKKALNEGFDINDSFIRARAKVSAELLFRDEAQKIIKGFSNKG